MIYALGRLIAMSHSGGALGPSLLANIAQVTGGRAFTLENPNEMPAVAHRIGTE